MQQQWKLLIEHLYQDFIDFFLPDWTDKIDFQRPATFLRLPERVVLSKPEAHQENLVIGTRFRDQEMALLLLCLEKTGYDNVVFSQQLFQDFVAVREEVAYKIPTTILTIFLANSVPARYEQHEYEFAQTRLQLDFQKYVVREQYLDDLWEMVNPIAFAVAACRLQLENQRHIRGRLESKKVIAEKLFKRYIRQRINLDAVLVLLSFIDTTIDLPTEIETIYRDEMRAFVASQSLIPKSGLEQLLQQFPTT
ncbi:MAG: hypothetical protein AAGI23_03905 [Bacteroidota bacterium]